MNIVEPITAKYSAKDVSKEYNFQEEVDTYFDAEDDFLNDFHM